MNFFLKIYDYLSSHKALSWLLILLCVVLCIIATLRLNYKEDIADFLPLTPRQQEEMQIYQQISGAERIIVIFEGGTTDQKLDAIDHFANLAQTDSVIATHLTTQIDFQYYLSIINFVYTHIPYFLTEDDYSHIDSLLTSPLLVDRSLDNCQRILQMPVTGFAKQTIGNDPLGLYAPIIASLQDFQPQTGGFSSVDGYMLTEDEEMAFAFIETPYGANETKENTKLVKTLEDLCSQVKAEYEDVDVRLLGAPVISVGNASRIKADSMLAILLSIVFIIALLVYSFRRDLRSLLLIVVTIAFGWLFGMAIMGIVRHEVSIIVLGIGSIIIGIAVNYPLHILFHRRYTQSVRQTLEEVLSPLIIGNITTVGAFLTLIPLKAVALRDLGIFAASMLVGTILFSVIFLPLLMKKNTPSRSEKLRANPSQSEPLRETPSHSEKLRYISLAVLAAITIGLYFAGRSITFDSDITHINYMTPQQRADFAHFAQMAGEHGNEDIYLVEPQTSISSPQTILSHIETYNQIHTTYDLIPTTNNQRSDTSRNHLPTIHSVYRWLPSTEEQERRIALWNNFWQTRREPLLAELSASTKRHGFSQTAFHGFENTLTADWQPAPFSDFEDLATGMLRGYWLSTTPNQIPSTYDSANIMLVTRISVPAAEAHAVEQQLAYAIDNPDTHVFNIHSLNRTLASELSSNFDYIGLVCSLLVFFFLWITMRSLRSAIVAFLPMAVSWVWILGIMNLLGLQFNIVNVILATFIFGQGDDYTIFVVEGLQYEHETGKPMLPQYRNSIILSALIMFIGIGVLVIARHPAMHSLGAVTLIGMAVVVLLANILPPLCRRLLFKHNNTK